MNPYRCTCGHLHGSRPCESVIGDGPDGPEYCRCARFRHGITTAQGSRRIDQGGTAFTSPLYHLSAYGLQNPVVTWCITNGVYVDMEDRMPTEQDVGDGLSRQIALGLGIPIDPIHRQLRS